MDTLTESISSVNETLVEAYSDAVATMQAQVLSFHRDAATALAKVTELAPWLPPVERPTSPDTFVGRAFDYQAKRLEADKQFTLALVDAWAPKVTTSRSTKSSK